MATTQSGPDRRSGDRRRGDRRHPQGRRAGDSLFEALGVEPDSRLLGQDSYIDPGWLTAGDLPPDGRRLLHQMRRAAAAQGSALARVFRTYAAARAAIGVGLVVAQGLGSLMGTRASHWLAVLCVVYAVQAVSLWLLPRFGALASPPPGRRVRQWLSTIGADLLVFSLLHALELGSSFNYAALLVLPVLMAGVLMPRLWALATAGLVAMLLIGLAWHAAGGGDEAPARMLQSGLAGLGLFIIALVSGELASRLAREELAARGSLELARQQAQLNRLVIQEMVDGVLVVDARLKVRAANPAARALLVDQGLSPPAPFTLADRPAWAALRMAVEQALARGEWPEAGREVTLAFEGGYTRTLRMRVRFMRGQSLPAAESPLPGGDLGAEGDFVVLLLEDVRTAQARLRQEKLAAMGRVSAGVAHEIRNPLAAIAQANALLQEDALGPAQQRLARIVADNVARLKRLVDDVMEVAPGATPQAQELDAVATVAQAVADWSRTVQLPLGEGSPLRLELPQEPLPVLFDEEHLRRVLVNLLDNARRHAGTAPGAILLRLSARDDGRAWLSVLSDGAPIPAEVERHLFEPFSSTRSRGSGLGLYICRELCERYGASIEYFPHPAGERLRNEFAVRLRRASAASQTPVASPP